MNALKTSAAVALLAGVVLVGYGASRGDVEVRLLFILPLITARGVAPALGILALMAAAILWFLGSFREIAATPPSSAFSHETWGERPRKSGGGIVLLGPIPIIWGSDRRIVAWLIAAGFALLTLGLLFTWGQR